MRKPLRIIRWACLLIFVLPSVTWGDFGLAYEGVLSFEEGKSHLASNPAKAREYFRDAVHFFSLFYDKGDVSLGVTYPMTIPKEFLIWGKAHYLLDETSEAILAFQRGLRFNVSDPELRSALQIARQRVEYPPGAVKPNDPWDNLLHQSRAGRFWILALACYGLSVLGLTCWLTSGRRAAGIATGLLALASILATAGWVVAYRQAQWDQEYPLVVVKEDKLPLRTGNGPSYPAHADLPLLRQGMEARRILERGDWLQVQFPGNVVGWVPKAAALVDEPSPVK